MAPLRVVSDPRKKTVKGNDESGETNIIQDEVQESPMDDSSVVGLPIIYVFHRHLLRPLHIFGQICNPTHFEAS